MAKELMEIGGFITSGAEIVNHDNTLRGNGTVDSPLCVVPGYNETVLFESASGVSTYNAPIVLSDNPYNYEYLEIYCSFQRPFLVSKKILTSYISDLNGFGIGDFCGDSSNTDALYIRDTWFSVNANTNTITAYKATQAVINNNAVSQQGSSQYAYAMIYKIIGINRKAQ